MYGALLRTVRVRLVGLVDAGELEVRTREEETEGEDNGDYGDVDAKFYDAGAFQLIPLHKVSS